MKTTEELNAIREQIAKLGDELKELSETELEEVGGGQICPAQRTSLIGPPGTGKTLLASTLSLGGTSVLIVVDTPNKK